ncbi:ADP-ribosyltransferase domain-containing protein [Nocardioides sp. SYSU DS0663]|uniref:ADP-ribosyltransferase domain-containing protein n=1 Tax=Nocardioides sp. SYSU DS0663 TaxID=3416445 RepID=UPI003F4C40F5
MTQDERLTTFLQGLAELPAYDGLCFRGRPVGSGFGRTGQVVVTTGITATSRDPRIATENFTSAGLYAVKSATGRAIEQLSSSPQQREVVLAPGSVLLVVDSARIGDLPLTIVEELDVHVPPGSAGTVDRDELRHAVARQVVAAQRRSDVPVDAPGKFVGDIS